MFVCYTILSVPCGLVVTCLERTDLFVFLYVMFSCVFVTFQYGVLSHVWYLIVSIPDLCILPHCVFVTFQYGVLSHVWYLIVSIPDLCILPHLNKILKRLKNTMRTIESNTMLRCEQERNVRKDLK